VNEKNSKAKARYMEIAVGSDKWMVTVIGIRPVLDLSNLRKVGMIWDKVALLVAVDLNAVAYVDS